MEKAEFEQLAVRLRPSLISSARRILGRDDEADDAAQDTLLKLWFFRSRLNGYDKPEALTHLILRRVCISMLRKRRDHDGLEEHTDIAADDTSAMIDPGLTAAIESLPEMEQAVLRLKHLEGMETPDIAALVGSNPGAVRAALSRARKKVRDIYMNSYHL